MRIASQSSVSADLPQLASNGKASAIPFFMFLIPANGGNEKVQASAAVSSGSQSQSDETADSDATEQGTAAETQATGSQDFSAHSTTQTIPFFSFQRPAISGNEEEQTSGAISSVPQSQEDGIVQSTDSEPEPGTDLAVNEAVDDGAQTTTATASLLAFQMPANSGSGKAQTSTTISNGSQAQAARTVRNAASKAGQTARFKAHESSGSSAASTTAVNPLFSFQMATNAGDQSVQASQAVSTRAQTERDAAAQNVSSEAGKATASLASVPAEIGTSTTQWNRSTPFQALSSDTSETAQASGAALSTSQPASIGASRNKDSQAAQAANTVVSASTDRSAQTAAESLPLLSFQMPASDSGEKVDTSEAVSTGSQSQLSWVSLAGNSEPEKMVNAPSNSGADSDARLVAAPPQLLSVQMPVSSDGDVAQTSGPTLNEPKSQPVDAASGESSDAEQTAGAPVNGTSDSDASTTALPHVGSGSNAAISGRAQVGLSAAELKATGIWPDRVQANEQRVATGDQPIAAGNDDPSSQPVSTLNSNSDNRSGSNAHAFEFANAVFAGRSDSTASTTHGLSGQRSANANGAAAGDAAQSKIERKNGASKAVETIFGGPTASTATDQRTQESTQAPAMTATGSVPPSSAVTAVISVPNANEKPSATADTLQSGAAPQSSGEIGSAYHSLFDAEAAASTSGINTSHVIQSMNESEMRVGMRTAEFGDISVRTALSQQQVTAQISVEHRDLSNAISAHASTVEAKLGSEFGLHASIEVKDMGSSFSADRGASKQQQQSSTNPNTSTAGGREEAETDRSLPLVMPQAGDSSRLDIQA